MNDARHDPGPSLERQRDQRQPFRFPQQARELGGKGRRGFFRYAHYSGSMIVSRSTMFEPRISM